MSARRTDMHRLQELIRLHRLGQGQRAIARQLGMGRDTIRSYMEHFIDGGLLEGDPDDLPDASVLQALVTETDPPPAPPPRARSSVDRWTSKIAELHAEGSGPTAIHTHLRLHADEYDGHLSSVKRLCLRLSREAGPKESDVAIRVETTPGEIGQVDFGYAGMRFDPVQRVLRRCWVFVMTLAFSRDIFCALVFDQKIETWLALHVRAFEYFGGVPRITVPDNLKAAVIRASFGIDGDAVLNRSYRELARYYGFRIDPTPPLDPKKKGKVESSVKYVKRNFLSTWDTVDLEEDQRQLTRWVQEIARERIHGTTGRRPRELFEQVERDALLPLPGKRWELSVWKRVKVHRDCHVQIDGAFYSVPWKLIGQELWALCRPHSVMLQLQSEQHVHTHGRAERGQRRTVDGHLPEHRRDLRHRSSSYWLERARYMGEEVERLAQAIFDADDVLHQLRRVQAVVTHLETYPRERARNAARRALHFGCLDYRGIKSILRKGLDLEPLPEETTARDWARGSRFARQPTFFSSGQE